MLTRVQPKEDYVLMIALAIHTRIDSWLKQKHLLRSSYLSVLPEMDTRFMDLMMLLEYTGNHVT